MSTIIDGVMGHLHNNILKMICDAFTNGGDELPGLLTESAHNHGCRRYFNICLSFHANCPTKCVLNFWKQCVRLSHDVG